MKIYRLIHQHGWGETRTIRDAKQTAVSMAKQLGTVIEIERYDSNTKTSEFLGYVYKPFMDERGLLHPARFDRVQGRSENLGF